MRFMFDTNAFDKILAAEDDLERIIASNINEYLITSIQEEEIVKIPDEDKRQALLSICKTVTQAMPTPAIIGFSKVGDSMLVDVDDVYLDLLIETHSNVKDAMIGSAAKRESCAVVTNDERFSKRLLRCRIPTMKYEEFIEVI